MINKLYTIISNHIKLINHHVNREKKKALEYCNNSKFYLEPKNIKLYSIIKYSLSYDFYVFYTNQNSPTIIKIKKSFILNILHEYKLITDEEYFLLNL